VIRKWSRFCGRSSPPARCRTAAPCLADDRHPIAADAEAGQVRTAGAALTEQAPAALLVAVAFDGDLQ
jgi:hypothetical protein